MNKIPCAIAIVLLCCIIFQKLTAQCTVDASEIKVLEIDLTGKESIDLEGDENNTVFTVCDPDFANVYVQSIGWNVSFATIGGSFCSEVQIKIAGLYNLNIAELSGDINTMGDCGPYASIHPHPVASAFIISDEMGCITIEICETLDNNPDAGDAIFNSESFVYLNGYTCIDPIPTLSQWGIIFLVIAFLIIGVVAIRNKRWLTGFQS